MQPITPGQAKIATLVSRGLSNQQVADALGLSVKTVKNQLTHIYQEGRAWPVNRHELTAACQEGTLRRDR